MARKPAAIRDLSDPALLQELADTRKELFNLRLQHATGQLGNYARLRQVRRDVARFETELRTREIAAAEAQDTETKR
jgi:large subunit ribosomal protein L29